jgi:hypothetical protein
MKKKNKIQYPNRKISETFIDFSSPILDYLGENASKHQVNDILRITYCVWNAVVLDTAKNESAHVSRLRQTFHNNKKAYQLIEFLISRKKTFFADDLRLIGEYRIIEKKNTWKLLAEARDPFSIS